ncbi:hypothetical protein K466DRAFT_525425 [Polyporus arcularius HHB13444]|uniref:BRCT domain-containing protein n=1 Tax=Polyporus arcularius HHB13444 TaxID=1314778 RepID=A0A5C3P7R1_9APHY|nr:hypothetical protein K466DRAFT_525425 [Polyporus arcularius HHB13444]
MPLFVGSACFSPRVPSVVRREWTENGGEVAKLHREDIHATHVFCDGSDDPWFRNLYSRSIAVFHWSWVSEVVRAQFRLPISSYLIEDHPYDAVSAYMNSGWQDLLLVEDDSGTRLGSPDVASDWSGKEHDSERGETIPKAGHLLGDVSMEGDTLVLDDVFNSGAAGAIAVSDALRALDNVSVGGVVQFIPGIIHMGKEFRCSYAR